MNHMMKGSKVGSSCALKLDTVKRLKTIASACEVPESAAHGLLVALNKYEALLAGIGTREGSRQVLETIGPLSDAVVFAKRAIRNREGVVVMPKTLENLRELICWHAKSCAAAMEGKVFKFVDSQNKEITELQMLKRYMIWASKMDFGVTQRCASSSKMHATLSASSGSRLFSISPSLSPASSTACHISGPTEESVMFSTCVELPPPGTDAVVARQPLTRVDLLVARLPGGTAIRGWCSRVIRVCISRARFWT